MKLAEQTKQKIKAFGHVFANSLTSPQYYNEIIKIGNEFSIKYYITLLLTVAFFASLGLTIRVQPIVRDTINASLQDIERAYPEDLVVTIESGKMSINRPEPYIIEMPEALDIPEDQRTQNTPDYENLIVIDTDGTVGDLRNYKSLALINEGNVLVQNAQEIQTLTLKNTPDTTVEKATVTNFINQVKGWTKFVPILVFGGIYFGLVIFYLIMRTLSMFIVSLLLVVTGRLLGLTLPLISYIQVAMHSITLPLVVGAVATIFDYVVPLPMWFFVLHAVLGMVALSSIKKSQETAEASTENSN